MRFLLTFYADAEAWRSLPAGERDDAIAEIGRWYGAHSRAGTIVDGHRLSPGTKTVRLGRVRAKDRPMVTDGPLIEAKEGVGSYCIVEVPDEAAALEVAKSWPAGGAVEVRPLAHETGAAGATGPS